MPYTYYISYVFARHNQRTNYGLIFRLILKLHVKIHYKATSLCSYITQSATFPTANNESKSLMHVSEIISVGCLKEIFFKLNCFRFFPIALLYNQKKPKKNNQPTKKKGILDHCITFAEIWYN